MSRRHTEVVAELPRLRPETLHRSLESSFRLPKIKRAHRSWTHELFFSGIRESDPPHKLGKLVHYRCANAAVECNTIAFTVSFQP